MRRRGIIPLFLIFYLCIYMEKQNPISLVHNIFIDFFGEENVDLQEQRILVHFPKVTVTNENDRSVDITELWVKVDLSLDGTIEGTFQMMRTEFTSEQFKSGYSHSHIPTRNDSNFNEWATPCLGSGPLNGTISSLAANFSEDRWNLFCLELSKYVTVESLAGTPYTYLEHIGKSYTSTEEITFPLQRFNGNSLSPNEAIILSKFIPYIIEKKPFKFNYVNDCYGIALSEKNLLIILSNLFIEWYNSLPESEQLSRDILMDELILRRAKMINNKLCYLNRRNSNSSDNWEHLIGRKMLKFKNKDITFNITTTTPLGIDENESLLLDKRIVSLILDRILRTLNNKYGHSRNQEASLTGETLRYI